MNSTKAKLILLFSVVILFQLFFLFSFPDSTVTLLSKKQLGTIIFLDFIVITSLILIYFQKLKVTSISILLLIFINFFTAYLPEDSFKTLPHNMHDKLIVRGDVMPGFFGINNISTDGFGFRVTHKIDYLSDKNYRIFAIGGSTTEEIYVDDKETWTALLEEKLLATGYKNTEVINTGLSGIRSRNHFATLKHVIAFHPDLIIFLIGVNDWSHYIKSNISTNHKKFDIRKTLLFVSIEKLRNYFRWKSVSGSKENFREVFGEYYFDQNNSLERRNEQKKLDVSFVSDDYHQWMTLIAHECLSHSFQCMFITQPSAYQINIEPELKKRLWMTPPNESYTLSFDSMVQLAKTYNNWLIKFGAEKHIYVCDISKELPPTFQVFFDDVHFNELGSKKVSNLVYKCIVDLKSKQKSNSAK